MTPWPEVTKGSFVQGKDGHPWCVDEIETDGYVTKVTIRHQDGRRVEASPTGSVLVLKAAPGPKPVIALKPIHKAVDDAEDRRRADRIEWLYELPPAQREQVLLVDRIFQGEWEDQGTDTKNWLIEGDDSMSEDELEAHCTMMHAWPMVTMQDVNDARSKGMHRADHQRVLHGRAGYVKHQHDPGLQSRYELLCAMAEHDLLYATKERSEADTYRDVINVFGEHPEAGYLSRLAIDGQRSGFELCACNVCHQVRQIKPSGNKATISCKMTPGCKGKMERIQARPRAFKPEVDLTASDVVKPPTSERLVTIPRDLALSLLNVAEMELPTSLWVEAKKWIK